jgi:hypothetical protein
MLKKAIELRRDYDDAMAYMNLMYRERADIQCRDAKAYAADLKTADDWVDLTIATKRKGKFPLYHFQRKCSLSWWGPSHCNLRRIA